MISQIVAEALSLIRDLVDIALNHKDAKDPDKLRADIQSRLLQAQTVLTNLSAVHAKDWDPEK